MTNKYNGADILFTGKKDCTQCYFIGSEDFNGDITVSCSLGNLTFSTIEEAEASNCDEFDLDECTGEIEYPPMGAE